jgi:surface antigen
MVGSSKRLAGKGLAGLRFAAAVLVVTGLAGCASSPYDDDDYASAAPRNHGTRTSKSGVLQCVPYARDHSDVKIWGDAYTWWDRAQGRYGRSNQPSEGAVLVLYNYAGPARGHVAVVRDVVSAREIHIDHANWLDDGSIFTDDPVKDVSPNNDWSQVRVFNKRAGAWGGRVYPVQGFIGPGSGEDRWQSDVPVAAAPRKNDAIATLLANDDLETSPGTN